MQISPSTLSTNELSISTNPKNQSELSSSIPTHASNNIIRKPSFVSSVPIPTSSSSSSASSSSSNSSSTGVSAASASASASVAAQGINLRYKVSGQMPDEQATAIVIAGKSSTTANSNLLSTQTAPLSSGNDEQLAQSTVVPLLENKETFALLSQTILQVSEVITTIIILLRTICIIYVPIYVKLLGESRIKQGCTRLA